MRKSFAVAACIWLVACEPSNSVHDRPAASPPAMKEESSTSTSRAISEEIGAMFSGLVIAIDQAPERSAVDDYAQGLGWDRIPDHMNAMLNASRGYSGKVSGQGVMLLAGKSNYIFSIATRGEFSRDKFKSALAGFFSITPDSESEGMGQRMELYRLHDDQREIGILSIIYGTAEAVEGTSTIGFISAEYDATDEIGY